MGSLPRLGPLVAVLVVLALPSGAVSGTYASAASLTVPAFDLTGTWIGQDGGVFSIRQAGTTVSWYGHAADGKTWAHDYRGTIKGDYVVGVFKDRPGYTNRYQGNIVVHVLDDDHFVWVPSYNGVTSLAILTRSWTRATYVASAKKPTFTAVVCTIAVGSSGSTCTAQVADATPVRSNPPSGSVSLSATSGTVGTGCTLAGTAGSPGIASCTVSYVPSADLVQGEPPPVTARYAGDAEFLPSSGGSSYTPASVLVPASTPVDVTAGSAATGSTEGVPNDVTNQNSFPVSADEQLTVPGNMDTVLVRPGRFGMLGAKPKVIGAATFRLRPFASVRALLRLSPSGKALLRKHQVLHAVLTVQTHAAGKPVRTTTRRVTLRAV